MTTADLDNFIPAGPSSIAIGVFDGVHLGHQAVLRKSRRDADAQGLASIALTFDPHPAELVAPERAPEYLCSLPQRVEWMTSPGLAQTAVVARFDSAFAALTAREFVERILVERLRVREVRVGADFRFGKGRQGGVMDLESMGDYYGFDVSTVHAVAVGGERISSTRIRDLVRRGEMESAAALLGRPFTLSGSVVAGKRLGRTIGYPTANLQPQMPRQLLPANGVYAGYAVLEPAAAPLRAAISVGTNPTTDGVNSVRKVEAYLMDGFQSDLYGRRIALQFQARVRDEERFESVDALIAQMDRDIRAIDRLIQTANPRL